MLVRVYVTPKQGILDPQGQAVANSLRSLGFNEIGRVRMGKYIELELAASSPEEARSVARRMCEQLLANTVIEDFRLEVDST